MLERGNLYELERCPTTLENNLAKPAQVEDKHILRLSKFTFTVRELSHIYTRIYVQKNIKATLLVTAKKKKKGKT